MFIYDLESAVRRLSAWADSEPDTALVQCAYSTYAIRRPGHPYSPEITAGHVLAHAGELDSILGEFLAGITVTQFAWPSRWETLPWHSSLRRLTPRYTAMAAALIARRES